VGDIRVGAVGSALESPETWMLKPWSLVMPSLSVDRTLITEVLPSIEEFGVKVIVKVVSPPEVEEVVLQMLLLSEGGFNTVIVGATPLLSVDLIVKVFVFPTDTICVSLGIPERVAEGFEAAVVLKKKSTGTYDFTLPLSKLSSTIITATQRSSALFTSFWLHPMHKTLSLTSQVIKPEELNVIPVGFV
jgi:hypothetical protein